MGLKSAEQVLMFDAFFTVILLFFGQAVTGVSLSSLTFIQGPPVSPQPSLNTNGSFNPLSGLIQATAFIGWAIVNLPVIIVWAALVVLSFINVIDTIIFSPTMSANGVPIIGFIFTAMQIVVLIDIARLFRGSPTLG